MGISFGYGRYNPYRKYLWIELTSFQQCSMIQSETAERTLSIKLPEFRKQIETYSIEELRYLTAELYKAIPKKIKEEKDIDPLVLSVPEHFKENGTGKASSPSKVKKAPDLGALESEIELFLENAYAQNYFAPNRFVPKHERPKWRFKVNMNETAIAEAKNLRQGIISIRYSDREQKTA